MTPAQLRAKEELDIAHIKHAAGDGCACELCETARSCAAQQVTRIAREIDAKVQYALSGAFSMSSDVFNALRAIEDLAMKLRAAEQK